MTARDRVVVTLTTHEIRAAAQAGVDRRIVSATRLDPRYGASREDPWGLDIIGALGELVVAKVFDRFPFPDGVEGPDYSGDLGRQYEVRSTTRPNGALIVHKGDPDKRPFILVRGQVPTFEIAGWLLGGQAKRTEWWRTDTGRPAYFAPADALAPIRTLVLAGRVFRQAVS